MRNTRHVDFNNLNLDNVRFVKVSLYSAPAEHLRAKYYVDEAISNSLDESSLLKLDPDEELKLDGQDSIFFNYDLTSPKLLVEIPTKAYADSLHENGRKKRY